MIWLSLAIFAFIMIFGLAVFRGSPYVPSHRSDVIQSLTELYNLNNKDTLIDIGSGDGLVLREAAKIGAFAKGYEINPILVLVSRFLSRKNKKISVFLADFWIAHLPNDTTVVYVFSVTRDIKKIIKRLQSETDRLNRPIHVISYGTRFDDMKEVDSIGAHHLYAFYPLQSDKAQV